MTLPYNNGTVRTEKVVTDSRRPVACRFGLYRPGTAERNQKSIAPSLLVKQSTHGSRRIALMAPWANTVISCTSPAGVINNAVYTTALPQPSAARTTSRSDVS
ncbi:hypothetical protein Y900_030935 [Mycolicibacterium aromaticivorans JS19b1 = JCM 16368]|uniref:Uncharacterized protein n=1 Tax=Mycolicibacterium aromaticivorans JS19b1 = JCM 16368 TaxID=1440774 RepID=A0A064C7X2_9MYCO|nr:hypothetical protein Y900_030735 [Mycolicibacterium aromaticivorans JS19b1 = JCM 16368]KDE96744.1 hypothetical protein Y900_030935 [Mycolicibacterium aromaticivorans JS19b1 = JCM 16368]